MLPTPNCTFKIPNLNDHLELDCRLYFPRQSSQRRDYSVAGFAIFAHPYAPLGGSFDDGIVHTVGSLLLKQELVLCTFNFRGAANSPGKTSWTGKPELADYVSVYTFVLSLMNAPEVANHVAMTHGRSLLVLGGYSYGSMIASHLPNFRIVRSCYHPSRDGSPDHEIETKARELAKVLLGFIETETLRRQAKLRTENISGSSNLTRELIMGGYESDDTGRRISRDSPHHSFDVERVRHSIDRVRNRLSLKGNVAAFDHNDAAASLPAELQSSLLEPHTVCLLVSPLLQPVAGFATTFSKLVFERRGMTTTPKAQETVVQNLSEIPTLAIYGDRDMFTAARRLRRWAQELHQTPGSQFQSEEVTGAGHFWIEEGVRMKLATTVNAWLASLTSDNRKEADS